MSPEVEQNNVSVIVVMGVSGAGKSTIAALLAARLDWIYEDADWFHPPANIEKMHDREMMRSAAAATAGRGSS